MKKFDSDIRFRKDFISLSNKIKETGIVETEDADFDFLPTLRCNLTCNHCRQDEVRKDNDWTEIKDEMSFEQVKKAWDNIAIEGKIVKINGGEPFIRKDMFDILQYFKGRGAYNIIATNTTIFSKKENLNRLRECGLVEITCSLDGIGKTHDMVRRQKGLFDTVCNFVKELSKDHKILIECCVQKENVDELPKILSMKKELGIYKIRFQLPVFATCSDVEEAASVLGEKINYEAQIKESPNYDFTFEDFVESYNIMNRDGAAFDMHPKYFDLSSELCLNRNIRSKYNLICTYMFRSKIDPNGDVRFCPYIIKSFGNILKEPFEEIWNSEEFMKFRKKIINNNMLPSCENCPHLRIDSRK